ncbi:ABC transporter substrate-binding protein [Rhodococcus sp. HM1]|uniref:ABC transporter substrate-binding protein n=1 Tax=unclassified Rhodococcus (in: high G+C Gram-positive bacteria) TaxID=192944 RepID=UPI0018CFDD62|nr:MULTISPECIES: ABC transporter substrate-binding protein [unclassified Rhodococcus (in: high G+C Gram-positive bacteria)]MBH0119781.1 ABC transporter substrate-binding protein [Rhodococcus sp. CX]MCK8672806.1 ABC transporter substrate-binding protein [Rhodococcus sp. HM1]
MPTQHDPAQTAASSQRIIPRRALACLALPAVVGLALTGCSTSGSSPSSGGAEVSGDTVTVDSSACPPDATAALADGADIVVGTSLAMSGPASSSAVTLGGANAYFDKVNAAGGVDGHKIRFETKDDALDPARAVANVKSLIEQDKVFATILQLGTPQSQATRAMYEKNCVPQLYVSSGAPDFYDPAAHQWSTSNFLPYEVWGQATVDYLTKTFPQGAKIGELVWNSDTGKASSTALSEAIKGGNATVVAQTTHDSTAVSLSNQTGEILAASPDVIVASTGGAFCTQLVSEARRAGFKGPIMMPLACRDTTQFFEPLGDLATNVLAVRSSLDPASTRDAENADVKTYLADMAAFQPSANARSTYVADGYRFAALLVEQLGRAAKSEAGLTRAALMDAVWSTDTNLAMNFDGNKVVVNGARPYPVGNGTVLSYDASAKSWTDTGVDVVAGAGQ